MASDVVASTSTFMKIALLLESCYTGKARRFCFQKSAPPFHRVTQSNKNIILFLHKA
jgi:hypothetical protein